VATNTNEWRFWPRTAIALARQNERFTCGAEHLCAYYKVLQSAAEVPANTGKQVEYLNDALALPIVSKNISRIYHDHLGIAWTPDRPPLIGRANLSSCLGDLSEPRAGEDEAIIRVSAGHSPCHIIHGPNWKLAPGRYQAEIRLELDAAGENGEELCKLDVYDGEKILGIETMSSDGRSGGRRTTVHFVVPEQNANKSYEIRLWCAGKVPLVVKEVAFSRDSSADPARVASLRP
jgi:hypothetical protein